METVNLKCLGRCCSKKKECLRYKVHSEGLEVNKLINVSVNACNEEKVKIAFIPIT